MSGGEALISKREILLFLSAALLAHYLLWGFILRWYW